MLACFSTKGGSGCTVFTALVALTQVRAGNDVLVVDLGGDVPAVLGASEPAGPGLTDWLAASDEPPPDALGRLEIEARPGLHLLPRGSAAAVEGDRVEILARHLSADPRPVVVDVGDLATTDTSPGVQALRRALVAAASRAWLVIRPCYLALRASRHVVGVPDALVVMSESGRALGSRDIADVTGAPVAVEIDVDPAIARAVDAGLLGTRIPHGARRVLEQAVTGP